MKRARATVEARKGRVNCGSMSPAAAPALVRGQQLKADFVFQHMRRGVDLDMQSAPQGNSRCCAVWRYILLAVHDFQSYLFVFAWPLLSEPGHARIEGRMTQTGRIRPDNELPDQPFIDLRPRQKRAFTATHDRKNLSAFRSSRTISSGCINVYLSEISRQTSRLPFRHMPNFFDSLTLCARSITKIISAHATCSIETVVVASGCNARGICFDQANSKTPSPAVGLCARGLEMS